MKSVLTPFVLGMLILLAACSFASPEKEHSDLEQQVIHLREMVIYLDTQVADLDHRLTILEAHVYGTSK